MAVVGTPSSAKAAVTGARRSSSVFEVPEVDFGPAETDDDRRDPATAAFAELGVPATATLDEVKSAYRQKVKEVHPDQGGDEDDFKRVREAYTTAKQHAG